MLLRNYNLKQYNTFGFDVVASYFVEPHSVDEAMDAVALAHRLHIPVFVLGGGSNVLFAKDFSGLIIKPVFGEIEVISHSEKSVLVAAGAGVVWDDLVAWCVGRNWGGLENLSHIPGNVGAAPVQNIGAYGVEVKDLIVKVEGFYIDTLKPFLLPNSACAFEYRGSVFKRALKGKVLITRVFFSLSTTPEPNTNYGLVEQELQNHPDRSIQSVRQAIIAIRTQKLPDPAKIGNAGSFFKNPVVEAGLLEKIRADYPDIPVYQTDVASLFKLPAAFLIDKCGWKGVRKGRVGVHDTQPLVLVAFEGATGQEVLDLSIEIQNSVNEKFGVSLQHEVQVV